MRTRPVREKAAMLKDALKKVREKKGDEETKNYDVEAIYSAGRKAVRATRTSWMNDFAVAYYQQGQCKWASDEIVKRALGEEWAEELAGIVAQDL